MSTEYPQDRCLALGGKSVYGVPVGILMLDTQFPRILGDVGNARTWPFPVSYRIVRRASPHTVVRELNPAEWRAPFVEAAQQLEASGVDLITTGCGFLIQFQQELQEQLHVPILTSSLLQVPWISAMLPADQSIGILTVEARSLTEQHFRSADISRDHRITVQGMEDVGGYFTTQLLEDRLELDIERCQEEHEHAARRLMERDPQIGAIVLECTNMPPYADLIRDVTDRPVYDLTTLVRWAVRGIRT